MSYMFNRTIVIVAPTLTRADLITLICNVAREQEKLAGSLEEWAVARQYWNKAGDLYRVAQGIRDNDAYYEEFMAYCQHMSEVFRRGRHNVLVEGADGTRAVQLALI